MGDYIRAPARTGYFPLRSDLGRGSLMLPKADIKPDKLEMPTPQPIFISNMLPTTDGYASAYWYPRTIGGSYSAPDQYLPPDYGSWDQVPVILRDENDNIAQLFFKPNGQCYLVNGNHIRPKLLGTFPTNGTNITTSYLKDVSLLHIPYSGTYQFDTATETLVPATLKGLSPNAILGITAASGATIAYDTDSIYWSSFDDGLDFQVSATTGAGSTKILDLRGPIVACKPISNGFMIYTTRNVVAAIWSGQDIPWVFREVKNSAGIEKLCHITQDTNTGYHIAWTSNGLMQIGVSEAVIIFPELTEYINEGTWEQPWGPASAGQGFGSQLMPNSGDLVDEPIVGSMQRGRPFNVNIQHIGGRYLCISYGRPDIALTGYDVAPRSDLNAAVLIYDAIVKDWGKLVRYHAYMYQNPAMAAFNAKTWNDLSALTWNDLANTTWNDFFQSSGATQDPSRLLGMFVYIPVRYEGGPSYMADSYVSISWEIKNWGGNAYFDTAPALVVENGELINAIDFTPQSYSYSDPVKQLVDHRIIYGFLNFDRKSAMEINQVIPYELEERIITSVETELNCWNGIWLRYAYEDSVDYTFERASYGNLKTANNHEIDGTYHFYNRGRDFEVQICGPAKLSLLELEIDVGGLRR